MSALTKKRALFLKTESAYGQDPSSSGSSYRWVPTRELGLLVDGRAPLRTDYFTGRNYPTAPIAGPDGWSFDTKIPLWGLAAAAGNGSAVGADDVLDEILTHIFGTQATAVGRTLDSGAGSSTLILISSTGSLQDLVPVFQSNVPSAANGGARTQWTKITDVGSAPTYSIAPNWVQTPTGGVAYGRKMYRPLDGGGASLAFVYREDDQDYTLLGGRCTKAMVEWEKGGIIELSLSFAGDTKTAETKGSLPNPGSAPPATPLTALLSPLWVNGTRYAVQKGSLDLGVKAAELGATEAAQGRGDFPSIALLPKLTINPLRTDAIQNLKRLATPAPLLLQFGAGVLSGGVLDTCAFEAPQAVVMDAPLQDENGRLRNQVTLELFDPVIFSGSTLANVFQFARA